MSPATIMNELPLQRPPERRFWYLKTPEGSVYGPAAWEQLRAWVEQGRVTADCQLAAGEGRDWQPAAEIFEELIPKPAILVEQAHPMESKASQTPAEPIAGAVRPLQRVVVPPLSDDRPFRRPHRGGLILILGVLGLVIACPIFSLTAWVMGSDDLRAIDAGEMESAGRDYTLIGQRLGMVLSLVWIVGFSLALFVMLVRGYRG